MAKQQYQVHRISDQLPVDSDGHVADFHALRVTYITNLVSHRTQDLVLVQRLARLSTVCPPSRPGIWSETEP